MKKDFLFTFYIYTDNRCVCSLGCDLVNRVLKMVFLRSGWVQYDIAIPPALLLKRIKIVGVFFNTVRAPLHSSDSTLSSFSSFGFVFPIENVRKIINPSPIDQSRLQ